MRCVIIFSMYCLVIIINIFYALCSCCCAFATLNAWLSYPILRSKIMNTFLVAFS